VFAFSVIGFIVSLRGLFPEIHAFSSFDSTCLVLFDAALGLHEWKMFDEEPVSPFRPVGILLQFVYVSVTMILLLNLIIARMAVSILPNHVSISLSIYIYIY